MEFSRQQEDALQLVEDWLQGGGPQVMRLFGYAGTGKTTLAREMKADFYAAFTGKAAHVLQTKGCPASTIHSLIYNPRSKSKARMTELEEKLKTLVEGSPEYAEIKAEIDAEADNLKNPSWTLKLDSPLRYAKLLVIDECSMVDEQMGKDLLSFGCRVLVLGDPAQLPPIKGGGFFTDAKPDVLLTEVHRQARDNPILDLATTIRETGRLPANHPLVHHRKITPEMSMGVDQIICGKNVTRRRANTRMRELLGMNDPLPLIGDKVVCTKNNHELGILNGALYEVTRAVHDDGVEIELDGRISVDVHPELFTGEDLPWWKLRDEDYENFEYGYALTCHKAQGSQWDSVGLINECESFRQHSARWLYTAVTRAAKELWIARVR